MSKSKNGVVFIIWLILATFSSWLAFVISPPDTISMWEMLLFTVLACMIACIPIIINGTTIILTHWITLAAFLSYGLFFEMLMLQAATICVMLKLRLRKHELHRYFLNSSMLFLTSLISGIGFFVAGGKIGLSPLSELIVPLLVFQTLYFLMNQLLLQVITKIKGERERFFGKDFIWEALILLVIFPLGIGFYYLNEYMGVWSIVFIGIPFLSFALVLKLYNSSEKLNYHLQKVADIGHQLTGRLQLQEVLDLFIQKIQEILPVDYAYIFDIQQEGLVLLRKMEKDNEEIEEVHPFQTGHGVARYVWATKTTVIYNEKSEWEKWSTEQQPQRIESIMCMPIIRGQEVEGVLLLAAKRKRAFEKYQSMIANILCSYFSVALVNARHYEETKTKSERCALTKIYNYRFFEHFLNERFSDLEAGQISNLSIIMLDIDHFKHVNDTYGHQAGNEILIRLAACLRYFVDGHGLVARYGGEEFVILLTDVNQRDAMEFAESVRRMIVETPFMIKNELDPQQRMVEVSITASIGVATAPADAEDAISLIRHADRALYIGAKRAGRNRVAEYVKI
ncbi:sensor domain-containing diguanylate cyclase [Bacillus sp. FJAT-50079]|uniref:sensor domain-containing diguanylate cyclase n=1 Tax=Bacillus sp. FJAT-50079 TaxID=2833577 RepID=UPI001BC8E1FE|nr:sensor domain-containing diguanylate cyclase [Bacillus sp. FJAT-50079]MBS4208942.1 sensor domain-containing diguanylate cyclase [Bacillus sp. FJAT-50079]